MRELAIRMLEQVLASVPQIVLIMSVLLTTIKQIKSRVSVFNDIVSTSTNNIKKEVDVLVNDSKALFNDTKTMVLESKRETEIIVKDMKETFKDNIMQNNLLVQQNKVFMDIITALVSKDPDKIKAGVAEIVSQRVNINLEDLTPDKLLGNLDVIKQSLFQSLKVLGKEEFNKLLKEIGYEE